MVRQADIDKLTEAVLSSFNRDTERLSSFVLERRFEKYDPELLDRFLVISENSLRWMIELLLRDAVGITHNLDPVRTLVKNQGFEETPEMSQDKIRVSEKFSRTLKQQEEQR